MLQESQTDLMSAPQVRILSKKEAGSDPRRLSAYSSYTSVMEAMLSVLAVCLFPCLSTYLWAGLRKMFMKLGGNVWHRLRENPLDFGSDPRKGQKKLTIIPDGSSHPSTSTAIHDRSPELLSVLWETNITDWFSWNLVVRLRCIMSRSCH